MQVLAEEGDVAHAPRAWRGRGPRPGPSRFWSMATTVRAQRAMETLSTPVPQPKSATSSGGRSEARAHDQRNQDWPGLEQALVERPGGPRAGGAGRARRARSPVRPRRRTASFDQRRLDVLGVDRQRVVGEAGGALLADQAQLAELAQVVADRRLRHPDHRDQLRDVERRRGHQPENAQPGRVAQGPEGLGQQLHIKACSYVDTYALDQPPDTPGFRGLAIERGIKHLVGPPAHRIKHLTAAPERRLRGAAEADRSGRSTGSQEPEESMAAQPSIVLVHGYWGGAAHWGKVIVQLNKLGYGSIQAVENSLTSLADDAARTRKDGRPGEGAGPAGGPLLWGAVITEVGTAAERGGVGLHRRLGSGRRREPGATRSRPIQRRAGRTWWWTATVTRSSRRRSSAESFCQDLPADEALVMAVTQKAPVVSDRGREGPQRRVEDEAVLVPDLERGPNDRAGERETDVRPHRREEDHHPRRRPRLPRLESPSRSPRSSTRPRRPPPAERRIPDERSSGSSSVLEGPIRSPTE